MKTKLKPHPAANLFRMMTETELVGLTEDIRKNGQHDPIIVTSENLVLDGRNRLEACRRAKIEPEILMWDREDDGISPTAWVISKNLHRRHLEPGQLGLIAAESKKLFAAEAKERQKAGGVKGRESAVRHAADSGTKAPSPRAKPVTAAAEAAKSFGIGARTVERAEEVLATAPAAEIEKIRTGEKTLNQVAKETKRATQVAQAKIYQPPAGEFPVIFTDYPWEFKDGLDGSDAIRGGLTYPPMPIEEICKFPIPAAKDCALFVCVTNSHLIDPNAYAVVARSLFDRYGFVPKQIETWRKVTLDGTKERFGGGHVLRNNTEHIVRFERGNPVFNPVTLSTCFDAPRSSKHSEKPDQLFDRIQLLCPSGPKLEMFSRDENRPGWVTTGSEIPPMRIEKPFNEIIEEIADAQDRAAGGGTGPLAKPKFPKPSPPTKKKRLRVDPMPGEVAS